MQRDLENKEISRYLRVYNYYRNLILGEKLRPGTKLPSIRKGAAEFQMSRTTMETAYMLLAAEGYIISRPQSGFYVTDIAKKQNVRNRGQTLGAKREKKKPKIEYDFVTTSVDRESFKFDLWRRYMKSALRQDERLLFYGEPQGEWEFREVLTEYLREMRSVVCSPEQIVIGAGVQSLLHVLCPLLDRQRKIVFDNPDFLQGKAIFEDHGFCIAGDYHGEGVGTYYISPSQLTKWGGVMQTADRLRLIGEASEREVLIIEDDYNNEFCYFQKPTPSLQGLSGGKGVVYLGTFSKMLLPSIRMSFMALPPELLDEYQKRKNSYNQTASKAEQIAITQFIRDGHLAGQIRKSRKIHAAKAEKLLQAAREVMGEAVKLEIQEPGFTIRMDIKTPLPSDEIVCRAEKKGIAVLALPDKKALPGRAALLLVCTNVPAADYEKAMKRLRECWE